MQKDTALSMLFGALTFGLAIFTAIPQELRVAAFILYLALPLVYFFVRGGSSREGRSWLSWMAAFFKTNFGLFAAALYSFGVLAVGSFQANDDIRSLLMTTGSVLFSLSVFNLANKFETQPSLRIVKGSGDETYFLRDGVRQYIPDLNTVHFLQLDTLRAIECISDNELGLYREGEPLPKVTDCELIKSHSSNSVYVIWKGQRKHIPDPETRTFLALDKSADERSDAEVEKIPRTGALFSVSSLLRPFVTTQK